MGTLMLTGHVPVNSFPLPTVDVGTNVRDSRRMDLAARIRKVMKDRDLSAGGWSASAGLSRGAVRNILDRLDADPNAGATTGSLAALAVAAKVSDAWLTLGIGDMDDVAPASGKRPTPELVAAVLVYHRGTGRWSADTERAALAMERFRDPKLSRERIERMLDGIELGMREGEAERETAETIAEEPPELKDFKRPKPRKK